MDEESTFGKMAAGTRVSTMRTKNMDSELIFGRTAVATRETGQTGNSTGKGNI
jgi:hypothetical protein